MPDPNVGLPTSEGKFPEIRGRMIRVDDAGRVSLNDIWQAVGSPEAQRPSEWRKLPHARNGADAVLKELSDNGGFSPISDLSIKSVLYAERGRGGGTWAHPLLAVQYAAYISAEIGTEIAKIFIRYKLADPTLTDELLERSSPEASEWLIRREIARDKRKAVTSTWAAHGVTGQGFAQCTNAEYRGLHGTDAAGIRKERGLPEKTNVRDHLTSTELLEVALTEAYAKERIEALNDQGNAECARSCYVSGKSVRSAREEQARQIEEERKLRGLEPKKEEEDA